MPSLVFGDPGPKDREPRPGMRLCFRYVLESYLETRSVGEVWRATDSVLGRWVAVQFFDRELAPDDSPRGRSARAQFQQDIDTTIVIGVAASGVLERGELPGGRLFVVYRWLDGEWLDSLIARGASLSTFQTLELMLQLSRTLRICHRAGVLHRTILPGSIRVVQLDSEIRFYLYDFGVGRLVDGASEGVPFSEFSPLLVPPGWDGQYTEATDVHALTQAAWTGWMGKDNQRSSPGIDEHQSIDVGIQRLFELMLFAAPEEMGGVTADDLLDEAQAIRSEYVQESRSQPGIVSVPPVLVRSALMICIIGLLIATLGYLSTVHSVMGERYPVADRMSYVQADPTSMECSEEHMFCGSKDLLKFSTADGEFWIDAHEVTVAAYRRCVERGDCVSAGTDIGCHGSEGDKLGYPINCVSWEQARAYCTSMGKQLPNERQWERAARARPQDRYPWGHKLPTPMRAVYGREWYQGVNPVCSRPEGAQHLCDMAGNVSEWIEDCYTANGTTGCSSGRRVVKGGSFLSTEASLLVSSRQWYRSSMRHPSLGFRCAVVP